MNEISEGLILLLQAELLEEAVSTEAAQSIFENLKADVLSRWEQCREDHTACVDWYEGNAVDMLEECGVDPDLVEVLRKICKSGGLATVGSICRLTVDRFSAACGDGKGILFGKFMTWAESKIPNDGNIMAGVFRYRGFDVDLPSNHRSIIRVLIKG